MEHQSKQRKILNSVVNFFNALLLYTICIKVKNKKKGDNYFVLIVQWPVEQTTSGQLNTLQLQVFYSVTF